MGPVDPDDVVALLMLQIMVYDSHPDDWPALWSAVRDSNAHPDWSAAVREAARIEWLGLKRQLRLPRSIR